MITNPKVFSDLGKKGDFFLDVNYLGVKAKVFCQRGNTLMSFMNIPTETQTLNDDLASTFSEGNSAGDNAFFLAFLFATR